MIIRVEQTELIIRPEFPITIEVGISTIKIFKQEIAVYDNEGNKQVLTLKEPVI